MNNHFKKIIKTKLENFLEDFRQTCLKNGRDPGKIKIVFASKYLDCEQLAIFLNICSQIDIEPITIGENRVREAEEKFDYIRIKSPKLFEKLKRIMIGTLQTNKINKAIQLFDEIHSVDSIKLANALDLRLKREGKTMSIFLEVNISGEESKHGFRPEEVDSVIRELKLLKSLKLAGLMTMAPLFSDPEENRPLFRKLRELADHYNILTSMGMSNDWKIAIEEGTDIIRIGGRIFQ